MQVVRPAVVEENADRIELVERAPVGVASVPIVVVRGAVELALVRPDS